MTGEVTALDPPRLFAFLWGEDELRLELEPDGSRLPPAPDPPPHPRPTRPRAPPRAGTCAWTGSAELVDTGGAEAPGTEPTDEWRGHYDRYVAAGVPVGGAGAGRLSLEASGPSRATPAQTWWPWSPAPPAASARPRPAASPASPAPSWSWSPGARTACAQLAEQAALRGRLGGGRPDRGRRARARARARGGEARPADPAGQQRRAPPGGPSSPTAAGRTCAATWRSTSTRCVRLTEALLPLLRASAPSAIVNVASTAGRVARGGTRRLLGQQVRAGRLERRALRRGASQRRARGAGAAGLHLHRGLPPEGADRQLDDALGGLHARRRAPRRSTRRAWAAGPSATCPSRTGWRPPRAWCCRG